MEQTWTQPPQSAKPSRTHSLKQSHQPSPGYLMGPTDTRAVPPQPPLRHMRNKWLLMYAPELLWLLVILWVLQHDYSYS